MQSLTITVAGAPYTVQEFTIGQLEDLHIEISKPFTAEQLFQRYQKIIAIGLSADHPAITEDAIKKMRLGTIQGVKSVSDSILQFAGFIQSPSAEPSSGEAPAEARSGPH